MSVDCRVVIDYPDERTAGIAHRAIEQDNEGYVRARLDGNTLILEASAKSESSMLHTMNDVLSCAKVVEEMLVGH